MIKLSELICLNTELWIKWNKLTSIGKNTSLSFEDRACAYKETEKIIEQINSNISKFDKYVDLLIQAKNN